MILEHEIPNGSKLHFGLSARLKRKVENLSAELFYQHGFEEIVSPIFVYQEHQKSFLNRDVIHLSSEQNHQIAMRSDSTIDVIRIITKRLGRTTNQKKWFYVQPVFSYPTIEHNQIGAECIDEGDIQNMLTLGISIFKSLGIMPLLQITNTRIARLCAKEMRLDTIYFDKLHIERLQKIVFIKKLLLVNTPSDLDAIIPSMPQFLKYELEYLLHACSCSYPNLLCSPLLPAPVDYYDDLFFKMFLRNAIFLSGGHYCIDGTRSCGFGIYTDNVVYHLLKDKG
ncbi:ATP phosphoribosyltransferase regulatory subunit [Helicobacter muridarum]|uniref:ATP phosphoribosyltransferase n=1 Tax=Helicobacter muridarum TaxID=216 RepID=A0A099TZ03_9HELI|nr:ATP phosphoribosyltransferase regulatory subunit [Helicobacter muridarum]TLE01133.1 ATP phosphoribosyltransferase regulatory subunit [Helicobacter muridarum]STQ86001.1 ATP phosphoribosyltransferase [Helicobacter muridarum]